MGTVSFAPKADVNGEDLQKIRKYQGEKCTRYYFKKIKIGHICMVGTKNTNPNNKVGHPENNLAADTDIFHVHCATVEVASRAALIRNTLVSKTSSRVKKRRGLSEKKCGPSFIEILNDTLEMLWK